mgnify:CR=1 FL=1|tara:strand:- start:2112 stop:2423 length:312 start_codon:yes stop_codon:yes gene_type:complete
MNKVIETLNNKLKNIDQDIKSLKSIDSKGFKSNVDISECIDLKEKQEEGLKEIVLIVENFKRDIDSDKTIKDVLRSLEIFKEDIEANEVYHTDKVFLDYIPNK